MQTSFAENSEMRTDPLVNHQGELGSPHISRMEGDLSKINPLEHRDARSSEYAQKDSQSFIDTRDSSAASIDRRDGSHGLTKQSYQAGSTMIRPSPQPASWSNVVSSTSPIKFTRSSDETILTSNTAASTHPNFEYTNQRPRSFDANDGGSSLSYLPQSIGVLRIIKGMAIPELRKRTCTQGPILLAQYLHQNSFIHPPRVLIITTLASPVAPAYPLGALWFAPQRKFSRLSFEKACLYEPDTSSAVALVTWFVGRRLAISHGFFSRQQLQSGVHSCVASKIKEGRVTRTKVNRCMQIILNSCFHYIIPRSDGSEESGDLFRKTFLHDAVNDEHLVKTLPPPWNDLNLDALNVEEGSVDAAEGSDDDASHHSPKNHGNHSSSASQAGESVDSTKRSVLLCFNENIRSAADVFRCHNEFIRDVAHSANLNLSIEDWKVFFSGSKNYRKIMLSTESAAQSYFNFVGGTSSDGNDRMDQQGLAKFHTSWCAKRYEHDHSLCTFAHVEINRGWLRRDPFIYNYKPVLCSGVIPLQSSGDCFLNVGPNSHGQSTGFMKRPDGSPMLYIDPAPVSDFEGTLLLPGLQAIFRDYSNSVFNSLCKDKTREYGLFGYKQSLPQKLSNEVRLAPIGKMESSKSVSDLGYQN
eukprot:CCRYP_019632-RA/>CCRYP_019632-RA protein AED:0.27 eAED:0.29 QI:0/0/0/1/1/1/3/0/640